MQHCIARSIGFLGVFIISMAFDYLLLSQCDTCKGGLEMEAINFGEAIGKWFTRTEEFIIQAIVDSIVARLFPISLLVAALSMLFSGTLWEIFERKEVYDFVTL